MVNESQNENAERERNGGVQVPRSKKRTQGYSKRVIFVFILAVGVLIIFITMQTETHREGERQRPERNYRIPQPSGFAELAASMRPKPAPAAPVPTPEPPPQRIVVQGARPRPVSAAPRYFSDPKDAQDAGTLRTLKLQALVAKPVAEGFDLQQTQQTTSGSGAAGTNGAGQVQRGMDWDSAMTALQQGQQPDPSGQAQKQNFLRGAQGGASMTPQGYSTSLPVPQQFPYELKAGTIIPGLLLTGINSDLPGNVIGQVSENVWDTATGKHVLIPKGTRILGIYDSQVKFEQRRVLLVWNRLIFPNGMTLDIAGSPGVDQGGYSGLSGKVDEHWGTMLKAALLSSMFVAGAEIVYDREA
jgi:type IV secretion system protein VirB10